MSEISTIEVRGVINHPTPPKTRYLIKLKNGDFFLCLDKPSIGASFIETKGISIKKQSILKSLSNYEDEISFFKANSSTFFEQEKKENYLEIMLPTQRILFIINLNFKQK